MAEKVVPMIHVTDVRATVDWYQSIGFTLHRTNEEDGDLNWALLSFGGSEIMFDSGGKPSTSFRRELDLYVHVDDVDGLYQRLEGPGGRRGDSSRHLLRDARAHHPRSQPLLDNLREARPMTP